MATLLASAPSLDDIRECISRFYCGSSINLIPAGADKWALARASDGKMLAGVHVIRKRNRLRFEMEA